MDKIDLVISHLSQVAAVSGTVIVCLYTAKAPPANCAPMLREPTPKSSVYLDSQFPRLMGREISKNTSIHDGAVMFGRPSRRRRYRVTGWSFRLFPPPASIISEPNRGSAFNSCLAMSVTPMVDRTYLVGATELFRFQHGQTFLLQPILSRP